MKYNSNSGIIENSTSYKSLIKSNIISEDILKKLRLKILVTNTVSNIIVFPNNLKFCLGSDGLFIIGERNYEIWSNKFPKNATGNVVEFIESIILSEQDKLSIFSGIIGISNPRINNFYRSLSDHCKNRLFRFTLMSEYHIISFILLDKKKNLYYIDIDANSDFIVVKTIINYKLCNEERVKPGETSTIIENFLEDINIDEIL